jgi:peptide/nickel transport system permease protein
MGLRAYLAKRILYSIALVFLVITLNFVLFMSMPGGPMAGLANPSRLKDQAAIDEQLRRFGLLDPPHIRYLKYVQSMLTFQFGYSYHSNELIYTEIGIRLTNTFAMVIPAEIIAIVIGLLFGVFAAYKRGRTLDLSTSMASIVTNSLPVFWVGGVLLLIFSLTLGWFPSTHAYPSEWILPGHWPTSILVELSVRLQHLFLPILTLVIILTGSYFLLTRASMMEILSEDYLVTAKAKGLSSRKVLFKHAFKNASLPVITNIAIAFGFMLSGATVTETVFAYEGLGLWIWQSLDYADFPALQAIFFLIALCVIIANLIADLAYGIIDPRIKYE